MATRFNYKNIPWLAGILLLSTAWLIWWAIPTLPTVSIRGDGPLRFLGFSPDSRWLAAIHVENTTRPAAQRPYAFGPVSLWDVRTGREVCKIGPDLQRTSGVLFSPDCKKLLTISMDPQPSNSLIHLWDIERGESLWNMSAVEDCEIHGRGPIAQFTPNGKLLIVLCPNDRLQVIDVASGKVQATFINADRFVISPDSSCLAYTKYASPWTGGAQTVQPVKLWNLMTRQPEPDPSGLAGTFQSLAFSPDSKNIALVAPGKDNIQKVKVAIWNRSNKQIDATLEGDVGNSIQSSSYSRSGNVFYVKEALLGALTWWDMQNKREKINTVCYDGAIAPDEKTIAFSNSMQVLNRHWAMLGGAGAPTTEERLPRIYFWDMQTKSIAHSFAGYQSTGSLSVLGYLSGGSTLAVKNFWIKADAGSVQSIRRFLHGRTNEKWLDESAVTLHDVATGKVQGILENYNRIVIAPDGSMIQASSSAVESSVDLFLLPLGKPWVWIVGLWILLALLFAVAMWSKQRRNNKLTKQLVT